MTKNIYAIKDVKIGEFIHQFQVPNEAVAIRQITNAVNDTQPTELTLNTADFELYSLGTINLATGEIDNKVEFIKNCVELKYKKSAKGLK